MTQSASISSHLLSVTIKRWISLILCSVTASLLLFFLSEFAWMQAAFTVYSKIITANIWVYHASAFIAGIAIKVSLDRFRVSHPERMIRPNLRYPPLTISIFLTLGILGYFSIYCRENSAEIIIFMIESQVFSQLYFVILGVCAAHLQHLILIKKFDFSFAILFFIILTSTYIALENKYSLISYLAISCCIVILSFIIFFEHYLIKSKIFSNIRPKANTFSLEDKVSKNCEHWTLKDFQQWFKDDKPMESISDLEPDYRVYANRIYERLIHGGIETKQELAQHIALIGPFGCGKSSIILAVANKLKKDTPVNEKVNIKSKWLHCDIATWGIQADHVAQVILTHIIDTIAENLDMCAFRSLPKHYLEAMKGGSNNWQILSALLNKSIDTETCLTDINNVLSAANINLLITIQDIDRGTPDANEKRLNELASLLERLKNRELKNINVIIAMDITKCYQADIISRITDVSEHILNANYNSLISKWHTLNLEEIFNHVLLLTEKPTINSIKEYNTGKGFNHSSINSHFNKHVMATNQLVHSIRLLKKIMRRVDSCWRKEKLLGEVDLDTLLLTFTLRETEPDLFNAIIKIYPDLFYSPNALQKNSRGADTNIIVSDRIIEIIKNITEKLNKSENFYINCIGAILNVKELSKENGQTIPVNFEQYKTTQTLRNQLGYINYLNRLLLETIPSDELSDQYVLKTFKAFEKSTEEQKRTITEKILSDNRWLEAYQRFDHVMFSGENKVVHQTNFFNQLVYLSENNAELSNKLNNTWFIDIALTLIKNGFFEQVFNELIKTKKILLIEKIIYNIYLDFSIYISKLDGTNLINSLKGSWESFIDEFNETISHTMYIYANINNHENISSDLYYLFKIFSNARNDSLNKATEYINKRQKPYLNQEKHQYTNTLLKLKRESIENKSTTWDYWIESLKNQKNHNSNKNVHKDSFLDFILKEMEKIEQER
ncbi:hypothetical protein [Shewanella baltica]|uniref:hypothetical protein n=1 Tax=Shewanella baltica TaxID=62322 RepID=UPI003D05AF58